MQIKSLYSQLTDEKLMHDQDISCLDKQYAETPEAQNTDRKANIAINDDGEEPPKEPGISLKARKDSSLTPLERAIGSKDNQNDFLLSSDSYSDDDQFDNEENKEPNLQLAPQNTSSILPSSKERELNNYSSSLRESIRNNREI